MYRCCQYDSSSIVLNENIQLSLNGNKNQYPIISNSNNKIYVHNYFFGCTMKHIVQNIISRLFYDEIFHVIASLQVLKQFKEYYQTLMSLNEGQIIIASKAILKYIPTLESALAN